MKKKWETKNKFKIQNEKFKINEIIKILLKNRGLVSKKEIGEFLNPKDPYTISPNLLGIKEKEIKKAIKRIKKAIDNKENIVIYGDYDADGICGTAILWETLHSLGAKVLPFIPNREEHGYGLNKKGIDSILNDHLSSIHASRRAGIHNPSLIITVDNGIVAQDGVDYSNSKGIEVIITDHHQKKLKEKRSSSKRNYDLPKAHSIVWSDQVSGTGVAWFLAKEIHKSFYKDLKGFKASNSLELACIGTITDLMPVLAINRSLIKYGLLELQRSKRPGILALCQEAAISQALISSYEIGYIIGPRLNAMGRLENALESLRLLCTSKKERAAKLAGKLNSTNKHRQQLTQTTFEHAKKRYKIKDKRLKIIFLSHSSYNPGVIGLVAGKLAEEFYRPAIVIAQEKEFSKASARSIKGFDIIKFLRKSGSLFEDLGGHSMAAGFTIRTKSIKELKEKLTKLAKKEINDKLLQPKISVDLEIDLKDVNWDLEKEISKFEPFGIGNPKPTFVARDVKVVNFRTVGRENQHLKIKLQSSIINHQSSPAKSLLRGGPELVEWDSSDGGMKRQKQSVAFEAIAFNLGHFYKKLSFGKQIDICFNIEKNVWNGKESLELRVKDIKI